VIFTLGLFGWGRGVDAYFNENGKPALTGKSLVHRTFVEIGRAAGYDPAALTIAVKADDTVNAHSFGRGRFRVNEGLLHAPDFVVWGVVAHELAHDRLHHFDRRYRVRMAVAALRDASFLAGTAVDALAMPKYARRQEYEADALAVALLRRAKKEPRSLLYALQYLAGKYGDTGGWFSSHPLTSRRIDRLRVVVAAPSG
jgi:predicted Zn-dependent protease